MTYAERGVLGLFHRLLVTLALAGLPSTRFWQAISLFWAKLSKTTKLSCHARQLQLCGNFYMNLICLLLLLLHGHFHQSDVLRGSAQFFKQHQLVGLATDTHKQGYGTRLEERERQGLPFHQPLSGELVVLLAGLSTATATLVTIV